MRSIGAPRRRAVVTCVGLGVVLSATTAGVAEGGAIVNVARRALFAAKAGQADTAKVAAHARLVGGIAASRTPEPGKLVALDAKGRLPGGVLPRRLGPGETITGVVGGAGMAATKEAWLGATGSFPVPVSRLDDETLGVLGGGVELPECEGSAGAPTAPPGRLCIYPAAYTDAINNVLANGEGALEAYARPIVDGRHGFRVEWKAAVAGYSSFYASWAYTAPDPRAAADDAVEDEG
jgi:hypothetical protein